MKAESVLINILVALVAALASHIFWPGSALSGKSNNPFATASPVTAPVLQTTPTIQSSQSSAPFTQDLRSRLEKARQTALATDPKLKTEEDDLIKQRQTLMKENTPASAKDREALMLKWKDHSQKMRDAMTKADPSLQTFFAEIEAKFKAQQVQPIQVAPATSGTGSSSVSTSTNAAPTNPHSLGH